MSFDEQGGNWGTPEPEDAPGDRKGGRRQPDRPPEDPEHAAGWIIQMFWSSIDNPEVDGPALSDFPADPLSMAATAIIRARRSNVSFSGTQVRRINAALHDAYQDAVIRLPQAYSRPQIRWAFWSLMCLIEACSPKPQFDKATYDEAWNLAKMFANDMDTLRRGQKLKDFGIDWCPPGWDLCRSGYPGPTR